MSTRNQDLVFALWLFSSVAIGLLYLSLFVIRAFGFVRHQHPVLDAIVFVAWLIDMLVFMFCTIRSI